MSAAACRDGWRAPPRILRTSVSIAARKAARKGPGHARGTRTRKADRRTGRSMICAPASGFGARADRRTRSSRMAFDGSGKTHGQSALPAARPDTAPERLLHPFKPAAGQGSVSFRRSRGGTGSSCPKAGSFGARSRQTWPAGQRPAGRPGTGQQRHRRDRRAACARPGTGPAPVADGACRPHSAPPAALFRPRKGPGPRKGREDEKDGGRKGPGTQKGRGRPRPLLCVVRTA